MGGQSRITAAEPSHPEAMTEITAEPTELPSALSAGLLLAAIPLLSRHQLPGPTAAEVLAATGATRTTSYKVKAVLEKLLPDVLRPPGRPPTRPAERPPDPKWYAAHQSVLRFVYDHPGCVSGSEIRRSYSDRFRCFALELCASHRDLELPDLATITGVPLGTLKDWLRGERPQIDTEHTPAGPPDPSIAQIETVHSAWNDWDGGFCDFCQHVQLQLRIPFSRSHIADVLERCGVRSPNRRGRRPFDASAMRRGFEAFFPGAQWIGDGTQLTIDIRGVRLTCNLELDVDAASGAFVGASLRPTEDSAAVVEAFTDGVDTTGEPPLALLLDNKPSNHAEAVDQALGETRRIRSRPFTPTDKPHVEGGFGLFAQETPALRITATTPDELAREVVALVVTTWARAVNHRPRADRGGQTRVEIYRQQKPTPDQIARAKATLEQRLRKQERARLTRAARLDPHVRAILEQAFARLGLDDPEGHLRNAIASWPLDDILAGIAIFEAKRSRGTLPDGADARYLRGIVKNIAQQAEGWAIAEELLRARLAARDLALDELTRQRDALATERPEPEQRLVATIDRGLTAQRRIDRTFWLLAAADFISDLPGHQQRDFLRLAARRIHANQRAPHRDRLAATRFLFAKVLPIA